MTLDQRSLNIVLAHVTDKAVDGLALDMAQEIVSTVCDNWQTYKQDWGWTEICTLALTFRNILWEIKENGNLQTHPENLLAHAANQMRAYECRGYPRLLTYFCRAFGRQLSNFTTLARREFNGNFDHWRIYDDGSASRSDNSARRFIIEEVYSHDEFGKEKDFLGYYVCERLYGLFDCRGENDIHPDYVDIRELYKVVPFKSESKAKFFIAQLVELLNTGYKHKKEGRDYVVDHTQDDYIHQAAAQLIRETLAQAPVEQILLREEEEAAKRAEQLEKERIQREKEEREAAKLAERAAKLCNDSHVYILLYGNGIVKIGKANHLFKRVNSLLGGTPLEILKWACTEPIREYQAKEFEKQCHAHFANKNLRILYPEKKIRSKECFEITFEEAVDYLKTLTPLAEISDNPL